MRAFWIDRETNTARVVETDGGINDMYRMCHCGCIDIAGITVDGVRLNAVVDDEGFLKDEPMVTVFRKDGSPMLAGSVLVFGEADYDGDLTGLTPRQIEALANNTRMVMMSDLTSRTILFAD